MEESHRVAALESQSVGAAMNIIGDIKQRDLNSGALWFTGPSSFTSLAARDRRALLAYIVLMEATMKVLPDGSRRTYEGMEAECEKWKADFERLMRDANESSRILGDRCEMLETENKRLTAELECWRGDEEG